MFKQVRIGVSRDARPADPWESSSLRGHFAFVPAGPSVLKMPGLRQLGWPPTVSSPLDGARNPAMRFSRVVFPAPFGPRSPVMPGPIVIVMSLTATRLPYQRETLRSSTVLA